MIRFVLRRPRFVSKPSGNPSWKAIHNAADARVPALKKAILAAMAEARNALPMEELARAVALRAPELLVGALDVHALRTRIEAATVPILRACVAAGAKAGAGRLPVQKRTQPKPKPKQPPKPSLSMELLFDLNNPEAVRLAAIAATRLSGQVAENTVRAIRAMLDETLRGQADVSGLAGRIARELGDSLGMTEPQAGALLRYEAALRKEGMAESLIRQRVAAQRQAYIQDRALTIARTETMSATNAGQDAVWRRARESGMLPEGMEREWITTPDDRTCEFCAPLDGKRAKEGEAFPGTDVYYPPLHPQCRCSLSLVVPDVELAEAA